LKLRREQLIVDVQDTDYENINVALEVEDGPDGE
jgi:hypothetical protein